MEKSVDCTARPAIPKERPCSLSQFLLGRLGGGCYSVWFGSACFGFAQILLPTVDSGWTAVPDESDRIFGLFPLPANPMDPAEFGVDPCLHHRANNGMPLGSNSTFYLWSE